ncbi:serpin family protein [Coleofasciculus sp. FACHB-1120]|uniref:serpin family protein n=1 Tax=Coleofasciculus sp. FACHB-1120 TaxID=2692783 RepID=UPI0016825093|nr:serpin family protein [Coleofasciculus sp. FACHB-1120]MBD2742475.1 serpin family protein [Coleofasciculus sp. FACHB-1120]
MVNNKLVAANTQFAFKLFRQLTKQEPDKNIFVSPASIAIALSMTYNGSVGQTQAGMAIALGLQEMSLPQVNEANSQLRQALENLDNEVELAIANSLWAQQDIQFNQDFLQRIQEFYDAKVTNLDFSNSDALTTINNWVNENTHGKIKTILSQLSPLAILILINAIYFKGIWTSPFDKEDTHDRVFTQLDGTQKQHPMMSQYETYRYYQGDNFQAVSLPYGTGRVSMYIFLPDAGSSLEAFHKNLNVVNWDRWMKQFHQMKGRVVLPRFQMEYKVDLKEALIALGMEAAFMGGFQQMCAGNLAISKVIHKTFLEVNEEGSEAAAATVVELVRSFSSEPTFTIIVDRPFFCCIRDNQTGSILFMGSIMELSPTSN